MFKDFYRDIDILHELVRPLAYGVYLARLSNSMERLKDKLAEALFSTVEEASRNMLEFAEACRDL